MCTLYFVVYSVLCSVNCQILYEHIMEIVYMRALCKLYVAQCNVYYVLSNVYSVLCLVYCLYADYVRLHYGNVMHESIMNVLYTRTLPKSM